MKFLNRKIFFLYLCFFSAVSLNAQQTEPAIANEFLVLLRTGDDAERILSAQNLASFSIEKRISSSPNIYLLHSLLADDNASLAMLKKASGILLAQRNHETELRALFPSDTLFPGQWNMNNTGQTGGSPDADIDAPEAWGITTGGLTVQGDTIVVAVIDCGADLAHEDLNFWKNNLEIPGNSIDDDNNGYIDDYDGWNAQTQDGVITSCNHGTHIAGIIGAKGNNITGVVGVNWNVKIMPVQPSSTNEALVVSAYTYVYNMRRLYNQTNGAKGAFIVATNSSFGVNLGQPANFPLWCAMYDSLGSVGILNAGAGPNFNSDVDVDGDIPTGCASNWLISVTNTTSTDALYSSAGYGDTSMDLGAPGFLILSTYPFNTYNYSTGTSMSTPHVAGAVALMWAAACSTMVNDYRTDPAGTALVMKQLLLQSVDTLPSLTGITVSNGRLNLYKSLLAVQDYCQVGVEEIEKPSSIFIFPNPAGDKFEIRNLKSEIQRIEIYDAYGRNIFQSQISNLKSQISISVANWRGGMYFVKCFSGNKFYCAKLILN